MTLNLTIDYLKSGRPHTERREVFLKLTPPFAPFGENTHFHHIVTYWKELAGIRFRTKQRQGLHSLRHTLATQLLPEQTPFHVISEILGHATMASTLIYAKADVEALRSAALNTEEVRHCRLQNPRLASQVRLRRSWSNSFRRNRHGYRYCEPTQILARFDRLLSDRALSERELPRSISREWLAKQLHEHRIGIVRQFALYMCRQGYLADVPGRLLATKGSAGFSPRILTHAEIELLLRAVD